MKRNKITEGFCGSNTVLYMKFLVIWILVILADFILEFRFEFLWPFYLLLRSVYDSYRYQGVAFSVLFVGVALTSDLLCYFFIPVHWLLFAASTYVWVQYVWHTERGVCAPTVVLWALFVYMEAAVRLRDHKHMPGHLDLCRPFAAHCIGYPVVTLGFGFKSYVGYRMRRRRQRDVSKENEFYLQLMQQALPEAPQQEQTSSIANGSATSNSTMSISNSNCIVSVVPVTAAANNSNTKTHNHINSSNQKQNHHQNGAAGTGVLTSLSSLANGSVSNGSAGGGSSGGGGSKHSRKSNSGSYSSCNGVSSASCSVLSSTAATTSDPPSSFSDPALTYSNDTTKTVSAQADHDTLMAAGKTQQSCHSHTVPTTTIQQQQAQRRKERKEQQERDRLDREEKEYMQRYERLRTEIVQCRASEQELRLQVVALTTSEKVARGEILTLQREVDDAQSRAQQAQSNARTHAHAHVQQLERRLQDERRNRQQAEQQLTAERKQRKHAESAAARAEAQARETQQQAAVSAAAAAAAVAQAAQQQEQAQQPCLAEQSPPPTIIQQCTEACRQRRRELEAEIESSRQRAQWQDDRHSALEHEQQLLAERVRDADLLVAALAALQEKNNHLENTLSAETRIKLDLFSALGEAKRQLEIKDIGLRAQEKEIDELKSKIAQVLAVMPNDTFSSGVQTPSRPSSVVVSRHVRLTESPPSGVIGTAVGSVAGASVLLQHHQQSPQQSQHLPHLQQSHHHHHQHQLAMHQHLLQQQQQMVQLHQQQQVLVGQQQQLMGGNGAVSPGSTLDPNATAYTPKGAQQLQQQQQQQQHQQQQQLLHPQASTEA